MYQVKTDNEGHLWFWPENYKTVVQYGAWKLLYESFHMQRKPSTAGYTKTIQDEVVQ